MAKLGEVGRAELVCYPTEFDPNKNIEIVRIYDGNKFIVLSAEKWRDIIHKVVNVLVPESNHFNPSLSDRSPKEILQSIETMLDVIRIDIDTNPESAKCSIEMLTQITFELKGRM